MSGSLGDFAPSTVLYGKFTTYRPSSGAPFTLAGTPALSVYKDSSTTESTTGVTLTADFDSRTGLNHFAIDTSADGAFYSAGSCFEIVVTTGTVDSVSAVGMVVGKFTLAKTASLKPTVAGRTLDVSATGEAGVDWANVGSPTTSLDLSGTSISTLDNESLANIKAQVVAALNTDTYAEPGQGTPPATTTLVNKIGYAYKFARNKVTQTATTLSVFADDSSTVDQKSTVSDDGTTYTRTKLLTGP